MEDGIDIGNYILLQTIGSGGFGKVKLAEDKITHRRYAVKIFKKSKLESNPEMMKKIQREISLMKLFDHPHIIKLIEVCESQRHLFIVLEYAENGELFDYLIQRRKIPLEEAMKLFRQIIYGVDFLHSRSICHRDLKPENILLDQCNNVKIADFGFARWLKSETTKTSCGSPHYAAPEVVRGVPYQGKKADIWSCGVILFALLAGRLPFNEPSFKDLLTKIKLGQYKMPSSFPEEVKNLISNMLQVDPEKRLTIEQIKHHKAFRIGLPKYYTTPIPFPLPNLTIDEEKAGVPDDVLDTLKKIGFSDEELKEELSSPEPSTAKSFWAIMTQIMSVEALPWSMTGENASEQGISSIASHQKIMDEQSFYDNDEAPHDITDDPFFRIRRYSGSLESPIKSMIQKAEWAPESPSLVPQTSPYIEVHAKMPSENIVAEIQKTLSNQNLDWLFPDDELLFVKSNDTYFAITINSSGQESSILVFGFLLGNPDLFNKYVDAICTLNGLTRT